MKPPKRYREWLQAHPAVWEALQEEWEPSVGDWCIGQTSMNRNLLGLVHLHRTKDAEKGWAVSRYRTGRLDWYCNKHKRIRENWRWLPTLGQLVRMLEKVGYRYAKIVKDQYGYSAYSFAHNSKFADSLTNETSWEIACTALWAKVKGVEND